jgi:hypothetical protein
VKFSPPLPVPRRAASVLVLVLLAACTPAPAPRPAVPAAPPATDAARYRVDPARSELRVLVYRAGPLAALGHNHVLFAPVSGTVALPDDGRAVSFALSVPVTGFVVDDPAARAAEGPEFERPPSAADVAGTRHNLLGPAVLDADRFPALGLAAVGAHPGTAPDEWTLDVAVTVRDRTTVVRTPARVVRGDGRLAARGELRLRQTDLGMTPFSVALGALSVQDELAVRFAVEAQRQP